MIINLNNDWRIASTTEFQWTVYRRQDKRPNTTDPAWQPVGYFETFHEAVVWAGRQGIMEINLEYGPEALLLLVAADSALRSSGEPGAHGEPGSRNDGTLVSALRNAGGLVEALETVLESVAQARAAHDELTREAHDALTQD